MYCNNCGQNNPEGANFCSQCGAVLTVERGPGDTTITFSHPAEAEAEEEIPVPLDELEEGKAVLVIKRGPEAGTQFFPDNDVVSVGRDPESDIFLGDVTVSRKHAEIRRDGNNFKLIDAGSLNGTFVNHQRAENTELSNGDEIQIGKFKLVFFKGGQGG
ncbi:MAG: FHA domain-containing protein [Actinomycetota bacterium]